MKTINFPPEHLDPKVFLDCKYARELQDDPSATSVTDYTDEEVRHSIVQDVLAVTFWEKQVGGKLNFDWSELVRFIGAASLVRVEEAYKHPDVQVHLQVTDGQIRLKEGRVLEQAAMDYCGVWYDGFDMPDDVFRVNRDALSDAVGRHSSIEKLADALMMDMQSTVIPDKNVH